MQDFNVLGVYRLFIFFILNALLIALFYVSRNRNIKPSDLCNRRLLLELIHSYLRSSEKESTTALLQKVLYYGQLYVNTDLSIRKVLLLHKAKVLFVDSQTLDRRLILCGTYIEKVF